jgi:hypothetical protein
VRAVVVGAGAVGARAARQLLATPGLDVAAVAVVDASPARVASAVGALGPVASGAAWSAETVAAADVVLLAVPGDHRAMAELALEQGASVVSVSDEMGCVRRLLDLDAEARERGQSVVVGAGFSPGLTCVLARHACAGFDSVDEVHVAKVGTGGPACARQHHDALAGEALDWRERAWARRRGGSGRELCWFPDPIGAVDCYRAALPDALVLVPAVPGAVRVTARVGANRRDRLTSRLPMLRRPHPEGEAGAVRVEVRGWRGPSRDVRVLGAIDRPAVAAGVVAAVAAAWTVEGRLARPGAGGLAELVEPVPFLAELARRGVRAAAFEGRAEAVS